MKTKTQKHTPGPWWYDGREVMTVPLGEIKICRIHAVSENDDGSANAKLIAAAPDMLNALIKLTELSIGSHSSAQVAIAVSKAEAVIKKAIH